MRHDRNLHLYDAAVEYRDRGWSLHPLNGKKPALRSWNRYREHRPTLSELAAWFGVGNAAHFNLGVICGELSGLTVVDCDTRNDAMRWWRRFLRTPLMAITGRGVHFYYRYSGQRNRQRVPKWNVDVRGEGGYVAAPPSIHVDTGTIYQWVDRDHYCLDDVPFFEDEWIAETSMRPEWSPAPTFIQSVETAKRYVMCIHAVSSQGGHNATFRAACRAADFGLDGQQLLDLMMEWNESNAHPRWSEAELRHKCRDAMRRRK